MDSADHNISVDPDHWLGQVVPEVECPNCGLHLTYVGETPQDKIEALDLHSEIIRAKISRLATAGEQGKAKPRLPTPAGYKCFFCEVQPLSTSRATWRLNYGHFSAKDKANAQLRQEIIKRDSSTCMDCSLQLPAHMEVRHLDGDHTNNDPSNLRCVCPFCHMRDHLGPTGFADAAMVIASTRQSQAFINATMIACWYVLDRVPVLTDIRKKPSPGEPQDVLQSLRDGCTKLLGDIETKGRTWIEAFAPSAKETGTSDALNLSGQFTDPYAIGKLLDKLRYEPPEPEDGDSHQQPDTSDPAFMTEAYANRASTIACLVLLPRKEAFEAQCKDWFDYFDKYRPVSSWFGGLQELLRKHDIESPEALFTLVDQYNNDLQNRSSGGINGAYARALEQAQAKNTSVEDISEPDDLDMPALSVQQANQMQTLAEALAQAKPTATLPSTENVTKPESEKLPASLPVTTSAPAVDSGTQAIRTTPEPPAAPVARNDLEQHRPHQYGASVFQLFSAPISSAPTPAVTVAKGSHGGVNMLFPPAPAQEQKPVDAPPPTPTPLVQTATTPVQEPTPSPSKANLNSSWADWDSPVTSTPPESDSETDNDGVFFDPNGGDIDYQEPKTQTDDGAQSW